eukprot:g13912.t1
MLRSLVRTDKERESYPAWPSIEEGLEAKRELERCREYYEHQLLPMNLGTTTKKESKAAMGEAPPDTGGEVGLVWAMKVLDILPMGTIVTLSTDWGEVLEKHPLRGKHGKGKVLWMIDPQEGFLERRPLEEIKTEEGAPAAATLVSAAPAAAAALTLTPEDRMEIIRNAKEMSKILRSTLRRGAYFEGAAGVHDDVRVHRAAMRSAATLMRKDPASRKALLECKGIEVFVLLVTKFGEEDRVLCEYGCWAFAVFAGEGDGGGDSHPRDNLFQEALVEAGGLASIGSAVEAHRGSASLRRYSVGALAAAVHDNAFTAGRLHSLGLHLTVAEDAIRRWPNDPELSCLSCWVLRSVVDPPTRQSHAARGGGPGGGVHFVAGGSVVDSVLSYESVPKEREGRGSSVGAMLPLSPDSKDGDNQEGGGHGGRAALEGGSAASASVFGTGDHETSDLLINLADDDVDDDDDDDDNRVSDRGATAARTSARGNNATVSPSGPSNGADNTAPTTEPSSSVATKKDTTERKGAILPGSDARKNDNQRLPDGGGVAAAGQAISRASGGLMPGADVQNADNPGEVGATGAGAEEFEGEKDGDELERLLKLAEATKVLNHDNEDTRKSASALVEALLRKIGSSYASSTRRRKASRGRVDRILREGQALGAL